MSFDVRRGSYELLQSDVDEEGRPLYARLGVFENEKDALKELKALVARAEAQGIDVSTELYSVSRVVRPPFKTAIEVKQVVKFPGFETGTRVRKPRAEPPIEEGPTDASR